MSLAKTWPLIAGGLLFGVCIGIVALLVPDARDHSSQAGAPAPAPVHAGNGWQITREESPIGDPPSVTACVPSTNQIVQHFPYHDTGADLCVIFKPNKAKKSYAQYSALVQLHDDGQILCGVEGCDVRVRQDDHEAESMPASHPADDSSNAIFLTPGYGFIAASLIGRSKHFAIELTLYQEGVQVLTFDTHGLDFDGIFENELPPAKPNLHPHHRKLVQ